MIPKKQLQSDYLLEQMGSSFSKEDCQLAVKQIRLNEIRSYMNYFQGYLHKNLTELTEERLDEIASAVKFFCRIEEAREGIHLGTY